jgi:putative ABC transport system permease protein
LTGGFAALALVLAAVGLGGVMAYLVSQRRNEIGIRAALGAQARQLVALVLAEGLRLALAGAAIGLAGGLALARLLAGAVPGLAPGVHAGTALAVALLLLAAALLASYLPARRAARIQPMLALKQE